MHRRHRSEIEQIAISAHYLDLAARDSRVLVRRVAGVINHVTLAPAAIESISECLRDMADSTDTVGRALAVPQRESRESFLRQARNELITVAERLNPQDMGVQTLEARPLCCSCGRWRWTSSRPPTWTTRTPSPTCRPSTTGIACEHPLCCRTRFLACEP